MVIPNMSLRVFISYRRADSGGHAHTLRDRLSRRFGRGSVFMDVGEINPGEDFVAVIQNAVGSCDVLIALIGDQWLSATDKMGRRLDNPNDWVRLEIATALQRNILVIPTLVDGASVPRVEDLPDELKPLAQRNAWEISHTRYRADMDRLIGKLQEHAADLARKRAEREQLAQEKAEAERLAAQKVEEERIKREKAEQDRLPREKAEAERVERERAEAERLAAQKAEEERIARERAEAERLAAQKAEEERIAREKAESSRVEPGSWPLGHILDRKYEIVEQLAITGYCEIYKAQELQPPRDTVVIKRLKPDKVKDDDARERFEREVAVLRRIRHQSVLSMYDSKTEGENWYLVTEFADKRNLKDYMGVKPNHKLSPIEALEIAIAVCQGLDAAHKRGVIHRDVKPINILLFSQPDGNIVAKLADFSIARVPAEWSDTSLTEKYGTHLTWAYASPEQLDGAVANARSDLFSWAVVFFEMLTGEIPTESLKNDTFYPASDEFPLSFFSEKGIPPELAVVLQKALHKDRELRYQSAREVLKTLESIKSRIITTDIDRHLNLGEAHIRAREWLAAKAEFEQGLALCEWYGEPNELHGQVGELAHKLSMGRLCAQGMICLDERQWQAAIAALEPLRKLDPNYLGIGIVSQLNLAQSEQQLEREYQRILRLRGQEDWTEILRLTSGITDSYKDRPDSESIGDIRKLAMYARGRDLFKQGELEKAYYQFYRLYEQDPNYEDVAEQCAIVAFGSAMRSDIPTSWKHKVEWLEKVVEIAPNHRGGRTRVQLDEARHRFAEELLNEGE